MESLKIKKAFTLAEVLITLGVIGVVAAITMPVLMTNVQARVQKEQVRSAKYKLTLATDKMKSLGLLNEQYGTIEGQDATEKFIAELKKHYKLAKICKNDELTKCWPTDKIEIPTENGGTDTINITSLTNGAALKSLGLSTAQTKTMGIITADGVPMILTYSPKCTPLDAARTYSWSTIDNKPETNATTNCISAIMDINGKGKPNRLGKDVRTWNSILGYKTFGATYLDYETCQKWKDKLGINSCYRDSNGNPQPKDYWAGAVKKCYDIGLHLPSPQTLANIAGARYGRSDITLYTVISSIQYAKATWGNQGNKSCEQIWKDKGWGDSDQVICIDNKDDTNTDKEMHNDDPNSAIGSIDGGFWSASELSSQIALRRSIFGMGSYWNQLDRGYQQNVPLCVGD